MFQNSTLTASAFLSIRSDPLRLRPHPVRNAGINTLLPDISIASGDFRGSGKVELLPRHSLVRCCLPPKAPPLLSAFRRFRLCCGLMHQFAELMLCDAVHRAKMSLLGALLLALVGTAVASTGSLEEATFTSLASQTGAQANLLALSQPGQLSSGETLPTVTASRTHDPPMRSAAFLKCTAWRDLLWYPGGSRTAGLLHRQRLDSARLTLIDCCSEGYPAVLSRRERLH